MVHVPISSGTARRLLLAAENFCRSIDNTGYILRFIFSKQQTTEFATYFEGCRFLEEFAGFYSCIRRVLADLSGLQKSQVASTRFYYCPDEVAQCSHIASNLMEEFEFGC